MRTGSGSRTGGLRDVDRPVPPLGLHFLAGQWVSTPLGSLHQLCSQPERLEWRREGGHRLPATLDQQCLSLLEPGFWVLGARLGAWGSAASLAWIGFKWDGPSPPPASTGDQVKQVIKGGSVPKNPPTGFQMGGWIKPQNAFRAPSTLKPDSQPSILKASCSRLSTEITKAPPAGSRLCPGPRSASPEPPPQRSHGLPATPGLPPADTCLPQALSLTASWGGFSGRTGSGTPAGTLRRGGEMGQFTEAVSRQGSLVTREARK